MRILIEIGGGALQNVTVEKAAGPVQFILADYDNIEAGDAFAAEEYAHERATTKHFNQILYDIAAVKAVRP